MAEDDSEEITLGDLHAGHLGRAVELFSESRASQIRAPLMAVRHRFSWPNDLAASLEDRETELTLLWANEYDETRSQVVTVTGDSQDRVVVYLSRLR